MVEEQKEKKSTEGRKQRERGKMIAVKVLNQNEHGFLVEYVSEKEAHRVTVPKEYLVDGSVEEKFLAAGVHFGAPWEDVELPEFTGKDIAKALHNAGIWTADDLKNKPNEALGALQSVYRTSLAALNTFAAELKKED